LAPAPSIRIIMLIREFAPVHGMFIFQTGQFKEREEAISKNRQAQRTVLGWFSSLRGRMMSFMKKLFS